MLIVECGCAVKAYAPTPVEILPHAPPVRLRSTGNNDALSPISTSSNLSPPWPVAWDGNAYNMAGPLLSTSPFHPQLSSLGNQKALKNHNGATL
ncbi:hypothetical protein CALVIDRAFT_393807 [Calocera viscosa TUFC12733]|uniref:Uncharacterized protein n=1 Tax=Calocera viscosa (strain TUFC12733) TaxID=1330018 RepID=A0A167GDI2_CALVF|nr:hypothetical protein CALVIDRAFT_393807 [Calocera viscosa TUFC12733]